MSSRPLNAVVLGATGAVGSEILGQLLASPDWGSVTAIGRREAPVPAAYAGKYPEGKLKQVVVDLGDLSTRGPEATTGADTVFCALGTTRSAAGSAEAFIRVDRDYVAAAAKAAAAAKVEHFSLVSSQGANAGLWAPHAKPFHGLLYPKTKGEAEAAVAAAGLPWITIARPGLLLRGERARPVERIIGKVLGGIAAERVAAALIADAVGVHAGKRPAEQREKILSMADLKAFQPQAAAAQ